MTCSYNKDIFRCIFFLRKQIVYVNKRRYQLTMPVYNISLSVDNNCRAICCPTFRRVPQKCQLPGVNNLGKFSSQYNFNTTIINRPIINCCHTICQLYYCTSVHKLLLCIGRHAKLNASDCLGQPLSTPPHTQTHTQTQWVWIHCY